MTVLVYKKLRYAFEVETKQDRNAFNLHYGYEAFETLVCQLRETLTYDICILVAGIYWPVVPKHL